MKFKFNIPVNLIFGRNGVRENADKFQLGKKALIVTGKNSAQLSGALLDVEEVLVGNGTEYVLFDKIKNNPDLDNVAKGSDFGRENEVDFIIAIGGGSPLDAAKAISALCTNRVEPIRLVKEIMKNKSLPIVAVTTTSGTGSEVTPYSILTVPSMKTKKNFYSPYNFPVVAFADPKYTDSLPYRITLDTAFDAFSHLLESYLSIRSNPLNDAIAIEGMKMWAECKDGLINNKITPDIREKLMYASCLGGIAITHTGTTLIHAMGYALTYFKNYSHGRANAMLISEYLKFNYNKASGKINRVMELMGFKSQEEVDEYFSCGLEDKPELTDNECRLFAESAMEQGSVKLNPREVKGDDIYNFYHKIFGGVR